MSLIIELDPETQARLETLAKEKGVSVNVFARALLEREAATVPAPERDKNEPPRKRSILELEGLGAEIWKDAGDAPSRRSILDFEGVGTKYATGQDAQEYVNELRSEWDHRP